MIDAFKIYSQFGFIILKNFLFLFCNEFPYFFNLVINYVYFIFSSSTIFCSIWIPSAMFSPLVTQILIHLLCFFDSKLHFFSNTTVMSFIILTFFPSIETLDTIIHELQVSSVFLLKFLYLWKNLDQKTSSTTKIKIPCY